MALAALALLVLNDHVFKIHWPGGWTGKLSDVSGLLFFPLFLQGAWEWINLATGRYRGPSMTTLNAACGVTAFAFILVQLWPPAGEAYRWGLGLGQWPWYAIQRIGAELPPVRPVQLVADPTDLFALPAVGAAYWIGRGRASESRPKGRKGQIHPES